MEETLVSYFLLGVAFCVGFGLLARYQQKRPPIKAVTVLLQVMAVCIMLITNIWITALLYEPVLTLFAVR